MYSAHKKYTFIAALLISFITGGSLLGMEEVKTTNPAVFDELPTELNRSILLKWLETILGYNYTTRTISTPKLTSGSLSLIPTCNPDLVLIGSWNNLFLYNIQTGQIEKNFKAEQFPIGKIAVNVDSTKVAIPQGKEITLWDLSTEEKSVAFKADEYLTEVALSPDGKYILAVSIQDQYVPQDVYLYDSSTKNLVKKFNVTTENTSVCSISFNRESNKILTATSGGEIIIWDLQGNKLRTRKERSSINCALFSPDERSIIVAGTTGIIIFDAHTGNTDLINSDIGDIRSLACSPDGNTLIAGSAKDTKVYVIDLKTAKVLTTLENFGGDILKVFFTSDGNNIISSSIDRNLCLHSRLKEEDNAWIHTRKETALELFLQLQGKQKQEELPTSTVATTNYYQSLQNIPKGKAFLIFAILAMILGYNL